MSSNVFGFFLGGLPGLSMVIHNMLYFKRAVDEAERITRKGGDFLGFNYSASLRADFLFKPQAFIKRDDGQGLRNAKQHLLLVRRRMLVRHSVGGLVLVIGAILGSFLATVLWPGR